ncbi:MAG: putative bifunctional diguanylate cyclase/phosphodiesterase [Candidatus Limnocylindrales bacterium]
MAIHTEPLRTGSGLRHDPGRPIAAAGSQATTSRGRVRRVRIRLALVIASTAMVALLAGPILAALVAPGSERWIGDLVRTAPLPFLAALVLALGATVDLILYLAHLVVRPAEELEAENHRYGELYEEARSTALEDSLTRLGNHRAFHEEFDRALADVERYGTPLALLTIDLDDFKLINDSAGHALGDATLVELAHLLVAATRRSDRAFRIGGDEFAILMPHTNAQEALVVARRLLAACVEPRPSAGFARGFSFSGGISSAPADGMSRAELLANADRALYEAKHGGRTDVRLYDSVAHVEGIAAGQLAEASAAIAHIVGSGLLVPAYQPIVALDSGAVIGFEGLTRPAPGSGFADPGSMFAAAEATGRSVELDRACITAILDGIRDIGPDQSISLNLSPQTVESPEFSPAFLTALLRRGRLTPDRVILELTEREEVVDIDAVRRRLAACRDAGFRIAIDDVGAGNAGLRLLSQIHFDIMKIDLSLIQAGARNAASLEVIRSLTELAARWRAGVIAEGVETPAQLEMLRDLDVPAAQGYLLARPSAAPNLRRVDLDALDPRAAFPFLAVVNG